MNSFNLIYPRLKSLADSLVCPQTVRTNTSSGLIKLIACICMAIDHFGKMCFPDQPWMRLVGRLAFPLFAYGIACGVVYTRDPFRYLRRIVILALICQPLYALGLAHENVAMYGVRFLDHPLKSVFTFYVKSFTTPSILVSLAAGLTLLILIRRRQWVFAFFVYILLHRFGANLDYGMFGIHLMVLFYALVEHPLAAIPAVCIYIAANSAGYGYTIFGREYTMRIFAAPAAMFACLPLRCSLRLPRWFSYAFYPAHLALLAIIVKLF